MKSQNKFFILILIFISFSIPVFAETLLWDDFSGSSLDTTKWTVTSDVSGVGANLPSEYSIDTTNQNYHTAQTQEAERGIILTLNREFQSGEVLEYDINYVSGSGNHLSRIFINNNPFRPADDFAIGYWNELYPTGQNWNNLAGMTIHVKIEFLDNSATATFTNNNQQTYSRTVSSLTPPYTVGVNSRTGHNGMFHFDYDNFVVVDAVNPAVIISSSAGSSINLGETTTLTCTQKDANPSNITLTINDETLYCQATNMASSCAFDYKPQTTGTKEVICTAYDLSGRSTTLLFNLEVNDYTVTTEQNGSEINLTLLYGTVSNLNERVNNLELELEEKDDLIEDLQNRIELLEGNNNDFSNFESRLSTLETTVQNMLNRLSQWGWWRNFDRRHNRGR